MGNQNILSFWSPPLAFNKSCTYMCVSRGSSRILRAAPSTGRICFVSSSLRIGSSGSLVLVLMVYGNSVVLIILIIIRLLCAGGKAGAPKVFAVSKNCGSGCTAPVTSFVVVVIPML